MPAHTPHDISDRVLCILPIFLGEKATWGVAQDKRFALDYENRITCCPTMGVGHNANSLFIRRVGDSILM